MQIPRYKKMLFYSAFTKTNEMVDYLNHQNVNNRDIVGIYQEDRYLVVIYEKIVEVDHDGRRIYKN